MEKAIKKIEIMVTQEQFDAIDAACKKFEWTRSELIRISVYDFFLHSTRLPIFPYPEIKPGVKKKTKTPQS